MGDVVAQKSEVKNEEIVNMNLLKRKIQESIVFLMYLLFRFISIDEIEKWEEFDGIG